MTDLARPLYSALRLAIVIITSLDPTHPQLPLLKAALVEYREKEPYNE